jgi:hypothetical protein
MRTLHLNLKGEYFDAIAAGQKAEELRLATPFWRRRLEGKAFARIELKKGYPKRGDTSRTLRSTWRANWGQGKRLQGAVGTSTLIQRAEQAEFGGERRDA